VETETRRATVKWFRGSFGFLEDEDGNDYFVHQSAIEVDPDAPLNGVSCPTCRDAWENSDLDECPKCRGELRKIRFRKLAELQEVEILDWIQNGDKGLKATTVRKT